MLPDRAAVLTAGVDVQDDRLEVSLYAWTTGEECWLMAHRIFPGDPSTPRLWAALDEFLMTPWQHPLVGPMPIHAACLDSGGHFSQQVTRFCDERRGRRVFAIKGQAGPRPVWPRKQSKAPKGKVYLIGVDSCKQTISQRLRITDGAGRVHFPITSNQAFFEQLNSEYLKTEYRRGRPERSWQRRKGRAAEAWDCAVYALAGVCGLQSFGIYVDVEAAKLDALRQAGAPVRSDPYPVSRSKFLG
ncbi:MAG: phage terminase large subunit family protein, partial [Acidobacteria bacterium]|nr:phage terminase large subunit family protein [Acidobacteriota bacterium]